MSHPIYRVIIRRTGSVQPSGTYWQREAIYCGLDREQARIAYHQSELEDSGGSYGNPARETIVEVIEDAETDDFADDFMEEVAYER